MTNSGLTTTRRHAAPLLVLAALLVLTGNAATVRAQTTADTPAEAKRPPALEGYCPVCIVEMKKWVRGKPEHQVRYDGQTYYFPSDKQQEMFEADPVKYVPALGGDCTVCYARHGKRVPGSIRHAALHHGRLFLFPGDALKQEFLADPASYADVDLALGGKCAVCLVEMNKDVPGKPEIATVHKGLRYQFPADEQRKMFLAAPEKYAVEPAKEQQTATPAPAAAVVTVTGKSGCAGCDHGVVPVGAPDELGLAVNAADGKVYVVEDAHKLYPRVYADRFEGIRVQVSGKLLKQDGKITWIQPTELKVLN